MNPVFLEYTGRVSLTGDLKTDVCALFAACGLAEVCSHCRSVAEEAARLAGKFGEDTERAKIASWLHDIGVILPNELRLQYAGSLQIEVLPEEKACPSLLHQKYSKRMAQEVFGITDEAILNAIECHTTLKPDASRLDMILFLADKLSWNPSDLSSFIERIRRGLKTSLEAGALGYIGYLLEDRNRLSIVHPWLQAAYEDLIVKV